MPSWTEKIGDWLYRNLLGGSPVEKFQVPAEAALAELFDDKTRKQIKKFLAAQKVQYPEALKSVRTSDLARAYMLWSLLSWENDSSSYSISLHEGIPAVYGSLDFLPHEMDAHAFSTLANYLGLSIERDDQNQPVRAGLRFTQHSFDQLKRQATSI